MTVRYSSVVSDTMQALGRFAEPYRIDQKRFAYSLQLLDQYGLLHGKRVLDMGSGVGIMTIAMKMLRAEPVGIDKFIFPRAAANPYRIVEFEKLQRIWNAYGVSVREGDIMQTLPFPDNTFDLVTCDATIEHLPHSPKALFSEVRRLLRVGGFFFVTTPNLANLSRRVRFLLGRSPHWDLKDYFEHGEHYTGHRREFTIRELCRQLEWGGFSIHSCTTRNSFFIAQRLLHPRKWLTHAAAVLSAPFPSLREMMFVLAEKSSGPSSLQS